MFEVNETGAVCQEDLHDVLLYDVTILTKAERLQYDIKGGEILCR